MYDIADSFDIIRLNGHRTIIFTIPIATLCSISTQSITQSFVEFFSNDGSYLNHLKHFSLSLHSILIVVDHLDTFIKECILAEKHCI